MACNMYAVRTYFLIIASITPGKQVYLWDERESTFITARGDEDVLRKAHIFTGPLLALLVNFRCPPLKNFNAPRPRIKGVQSWILSYRRYNLQFLKMSDILKHVLLLNNNNNDNVTLFTFNNINILQ
jgi:hypothetical protein